MDWKKNLSKPKPKDSFAIPDEPEERVKYRYIDGLVFPDRFLIEAGKNPDDFPECPPPNKIQVEEMAKRIQRLKD